MDRLLPCQIVRDDEEDSETACGLDSDGVVVRHGHHHHSGGDVSRSNQQSIYKSQKFSEFSQRDVRETGLLGPWGCRAQGRKGAQEEESASVVAPSTCE